MEGPSLVILREETIQFKGKKIMAVTGYAKFEHSLLRGKMVKDIKTWGKHFLLCFNIFSVRIHFGLFGSYRINNKKEGRNASISLTFINGTLNCYVASVKIITEPLDEIYDWSLDALSTKWNAQKVKKILLQQKHDQQIGDLLLKPSVFPAVGNIIRNEVLYREKLHPETLLANIPSNKIISLIKQTRTYSKEFLNWKKKNELSKHWEIYTRKKCPVGHTVVKKYTGKTKRRSFICACLKKYT